MMKKNNLIKMIVFSTAFLNTDAFSEDIRSKIINIPEQKVVNLAQPGSSQPIFSHNEKVDSVCDGECHKLQVSWLPLSEHTIITPEKEYIFTSAVEGIGVRIKHQRDSLDISLVRTANIVNAGKLSSSPLLRRTVKFYDKSDVLIKTVSEDISINGRVVSSGCFIPDSHNLNVKLPPVSMSQLIQSPAWKTLNEPSGQTVLNVQCDSPVKGALNLYFKPVMSDPSVNNPSVLPALTSSGKSSGVGFTMQLNNKPVIWDGATPSSITMGNTMDISIPIDVFYTRTTGNISPGNIHATALIVVKHQ
ncbi:TPA: fimbrial protein [Enterobacter hormaechei subsp. steigerwaltii]|uniref:fimbrial protein n=1 Tax=Enterobacter hormaechei TaxID=158836 RepID=UPI00163A3285|nr:fimbrial protein [Enterobacter hormaechei]HAV1394271.1 fimbrial protein [Enterobacter hormaechei subsp. steigerwaltii]HAV1476383.1 fimbrial protein [Enterobacter hormaechei subsp. steigerwaltii]HAV1694285.1 fimbrial protein [Enterobacter hormaechei subsp. steigerwaltii]HAV1738872.1 fimbrial protein [Enterobacter hormaechei subsp. steigerwaltii]